MTDRGDYSGRERALIQIPPRCKFVPLVRYSAWPCAPRLPPPHREDSVLLALRGRGLPRLGALPGVLIALVFRFFQGRLLHQNARLNRTTTAVRSL
jgi:hypothetical protein